MRAPAQHLDLDVHLEHVGGRRHHDVGKVSLREQRAGIVRHARLDGKLVDRSGQHVGGAQRERAGQRLRAAEPAGRADPDPAPVPVPGA